MKTEKIKNSYQVLKDAKISKLESKDQFKVIKALRVLKPIAETYDADIADLEKKVTSCTAEELKENREKAQKHSEAIQSNSTEGLLSSKEIFDLNAFFRKVDEEMKALRKELDNEEVELSYEKLTEESFIKLTECNDSLSVDQFSLLYDVLV